MEAEVGIGPFSARFRPSKCRIFPAKQANSANTPALLCYCTPADVFADTAEDGLSRIFGCFGGV
jgi:hypothetical protein